MLLSVATLCHLGPPPLGCSSEHDLWTLLMQRFIADLKDDALIESHPSMQGRIMSMIVAPAKAAQ